MLARNGSRAPLSRTCSNVPSTTKATCFVGSEHIALLQKRDGTYKKRLPFFRRFPPPSVEGFVLRAYTADGLGTQWQSHDTTFHIRYLFYTSGKLDQGAWMNPQSSVDSGSIHNGPLHKPLPKHKKATKKTHICMSLGGSGADPSQKDPRSDPLEPLALSGRSFRRSSVPVSDWERLGCKRVVPWTPHD